MQLLSWQADYSVENDTIDNDHKTLFNMINAFYDAFQESRKRSHLTHILIQLVQYAEDHFQREEKIMRDHGYPDLDNHCSIHEKLYETIFELNKRLESDPRPLDRETVAFLKYWLVDHILQEDKKVGAFLATQKTSAGV